MAEKSQQWIEATQEIEDFKKAFESKYGLGITIFIRNSHIDKIQSISLSDLMYECNLLLQEYYPEGYIQASYGKVNILNGIKTKSRIYDLVVMRQIFSYIAYEIGYTYTEIARFLGMNHSTIIYAVKSLQAAFKTNYEMSKDKYEQVKYNILSKYNLPDE